MARSTGKRGRAVDLSANSTTLEHAEQRKDHFGSTNTVSHVVKATNESDIFDLFGVGANTSKKETKPFVHQVKFHGPQGEVIRAWANVDDGAMREVMSTETFKKVKHRLGKTTQSGQLLRVANGVIVQSEARWEGEVEVNGIRTNVTFEVFDSGGKWDFLFGKTLLEAYKANHNYESDEITIYGKGGVATLTNQFPNQTRR